ncbi:hypothetical protein PHYPO_G00124540 [Pangasianodon hypophthalmus]|uniref:Uncharacterized protein n=1 Tax=Pangasianodon hypophthalmus TaxID=310915 RepID=A0A5N5KR62_PANHP|nr:hypothetical protein PHYPO_G00124540 [Pangasianodon hypophthalmus]
MRRGSQATSNYNAWLWTEGGNPRTWRSPSNHGENMQTPSTESGGANRTHNPRDDDVKTSVEETGSSSVRPF